MASNNQRNLPQNAVLIRVNFSSNNQMPSNYALGAQQQQAEQITKPEQVKETLRIRHVCLSTVELLSCLRGL